ncbi:glycosyltransferase [Luteimonas sp. MC1750]|uniref:glycosyltransferase n=1 Tax=Luteimonas sp. MC1750 TaxID=2799326 RepID=UPI0018F0AC33|nr:glycosyltransferase [Luteimonas sp. MC1750]MBJ6985035.1 glycosyltransferase [Luteimonas sp. MC1750]QQO05701.1 glycosyltransferase [Luteimonas sp. MC1750]
MKILYTNFHDCHGGGHTTYVLALARALGGRHRVHVAAPPGSRLLAGAEGLEGVSAVPQPFPNGIRRLAARRRARASLRALLREERFDLVHVNGSADHRLVLSALRGLPVRPRIVFTKHNSKPASGVGAWWRARRGTDHVIAVCDDTRKRLLDTPYGRLPMDAVPNGVDLERYRPWPDDARCQARRQWLGAGGDDVLLLGSNAGTIAYKGWMDLVEALALLPEVQRARVSVLLAGEPPADDALARIEALELGGQVRFAGLLDDIRPMVAALDAGFVLSWDVETISFACREMMAMGKPVLVSDYAGLPENIDPGVDGWVVPARSPPRVADAILQLLDARDRLPAMGAAARAHAERAFGIERFVDATEAVYFRAVAAGA